MIYKMKNLISAICCKILIKVDPDKLKNFEQIKSTPHAIVSANQDNNTYGEMTPVINRGEHEI